jgi:hypothetical protein
LEGRTSGLAGLTEAMSNSSALVADWVNACGATQSAPIWKITTADPDVMSIGRRERFAVSNSQQRGGVLKPVREGFVCVANFLHESVYDNLQGPCYLLSVQTLDQGSIKLGRDRTGQLIGTATVDCGQAVTNARERQRVVANAGHHVFCLPQPTARDATPCVQCV